MITKQIKDQIDAIISDQSNYEMRDGISKLKNAGRTFGHIGNSLGKIDSEIAEHLEKLSHKGGIFETMRQTILGFIEGKMIIEKAPKKAELTEKISEQERKIKELEAQLKKKGKGKK